MTVDCLTNLGSAHRRTPISLTATVLPDGEMPRLSSLMGFTRVMPLCLDICYEIESERIDRIEPSKK